MKILLTSGASYAPARGGSTRSNLAWLRELIANGHTCRVVCSAIADSVEASGGGIDADGIAILRVADLALRADVVSREIALFAPDWVLVSSEDVTQRLLRAAERAAPGRIIYLAHTPQFFPFGPESWHPDREATEIVERAAAVVAIGSHMASYIERHCEARATVIHPPIYRMGEAVTVAGPSVLMINPCVVKGIDIFVSLAERLPEYSFLALSGWGTTLEDLTRMASFPNIRIVREVKDIGEVLNQARVLLMPSLWYEGFGLIAMEAMLRGIPVVSSDSGGLLEAKAMTGYVVPVKPIESYRSDFDRQNMPQPNRVPQDVKPWVAALRELMSNDAAYRAEATRSVAAAREFVGRLRPNHFGLFLLSLTPPKSEVRMRILLGHNSTYFPSQGGGDKSNRLLMEGLAARGHVVRVVTRLAEKGVAHETDSFTLNGVDVHPLTRDTNIRSYFAQQIAAFRPDVILLSTDDPGQLLLEPALLAPHAKVVYLARATIALPFGPDASSTNVEKTARLREVDTLVGVSDYVARYIREHVGRDAVHVPISPMETRTPEVLGSFANPYVLMINPCAAKGISLFLQIADALPGVAFAAVPSWGTNDADLTALGARANVTLLEHTEQIDDIFRVTRVLLVPSVWVEARGRVVMEAMLRGIPVLASDVGGLPEAKLGVPYLLPVNPIKRYRPELDERFVPVGEVPEQDAGPWIAALIKLIGNARNFEDNARQSRVAALRYLATATIEPFETLLREPPRRERLQPPAATLSADRQKLIALRLRSRKWFPNCPSRVFAFPFAGAGTLWCRGWGMCPALLPARETRLNEACFATMEALVEALVPAIAPLLDAPYVLFGHSMGAGIAFEVAHALVNSGKRRPSALILSATKPPKLREVLPDPDDDQLIKHLERLGGIPKGAFQDKVWMTTVFPALRADLQLYRRYAPIGRPPLPIPLFAYCADADPSLSPAQMEAWQEETSAKFKMRIFPGGHFYFHLDASALLSSIAEDKGTLLV